MISLTPLQQLAARKGLNLFGLVDAANFDAAQPREQRAQVLLPTCGCILVAGRGGPAIRRSHGGRGTSGPAAARGDEAAADAAAQALSMELNAAGLRHLRLHSAAAKMRFQQLGEAAGFGVVSPVSGTLLHPVFGPWLRIEAALLVEGSPFGGAPKDGVTVGFDPCSSCAQPCVATCSSLAVDRRGRLTRGWCGDPARGGGCADDCDARLACPVGGGPARRAVRAKIRGHAQRSRGLGWRRPSPLWLRGVQSQR